MSPGHLGGTPKAVRVRPGRSERVAEPAGHGPAARDRLLTAAARAWNDEPIMAEEPPHRPVNDLWAGKGLPLPAHSFVRSDRGHSGGLGALGTLPYLELNSLVLLQ